MLTCGKAVLACVLGIRFISHHIVSAPVLHMTTYGSVGECLIEWSCWCTQTRGKNNEIRNTFRKVIKLDINIWLNFIYKALKMSFTSYERWLRFSYLSISIPKNVPYCTIFSLWYLLRIANPVCTRKPLYTQRYMKKTFEYKGQRLLLNFHAFFKNTFLSCSVLCLICLWCHLCVCNASLEACAEITCHPLSFNVCG